MFSRANQPLTVFILAGPTGGHLFPSWAFAEELKKKCPGWRLCLLTGTRARKLGQDFQSSPFDKIYYARDFHGISMNPLQWVLFFYRAAIAFGQTLRWIITEKPSLAVGFGSYASVPGALLCALWKIPILLHEQNKVAGKATRFLLPISRCAAASFDKTVPSFDRGQGWLVTGLPIRQKLLAEARSFKRDFDRPRLTWLVVGGSQGSQSINEKVSKTLMLLSPEETEKIAVIHITGERDYEKTKEAYRGLKFPTQVYPFFDKMHELFPQIDFALTRAGANTLFELALFGIPATVVPYPHAGAHQKENAVAFEKEGALVVQDETKLTSDLLLRMVQIFISDQNLRQRLSNNIQKLAKPDAGRVLAEKACALLEDL